MARIRTIYDLKLHESMRIPYDDGSETLYMTVLRVNGGFFYKMGYGGKSDFFSPIPTMLIPKKEEK